MQNNNMLLTDTINNENIFFGWETAFQAGASVVGGKAWNLGRLHRYGFDIPAGGVIPVPAYEKFLTENRLQPELENINSNVSLKNVNQEAVKLQIQQVTQKILYGCFDDDFINALKLQLGSVGLLEGAVAVRSSATLEDSNQASFAGIHDSFLNVRGLDNILTAIKSCFASIWTPKAIAYRHKMGIDDNRVLPAVILMKMVNADSAGVAFSCDPATGREDVCLITANFGLGESVVNGSVEPDTYYVERTTYRTVEQRLVFWV